MRKFNRVVGGSLVAADREKRDLWTGRLQGQNYEFSIRLKRCVRLDTLGRPRASIYTMFRSVIILDWKEEKRYWGNTAISIIIIRKRRQHLRELSRPDTSFSLKLCSGVKGTGVYQTRTHERGRTEWIYMCSLIQMWHIHFQTGWLLSEFGHKKRRLNSSNKLNLFAFMKMQRMNVLSTPA